MIPESSKPAKPHPITSVQLTGVQLRHEEDPRIKSPDDFLSKVTPKKTTPPALDLPKKPDDRLTEVTRELSELRARYDQEIAQWRDYEHRIQEWRAQVVTIVDGLRREAVAQQAALKAQEQELRRLRAQRSNLRAV